MRDPRLRQLSGGRLLRHPADEHPGPRTSTALTITKPLGAVFEKKKSRRALNMKDLVKPDRCADRDLPRRPPRCWASLTTRPQPGHRAAAAATEATKTPPCRKCCPGSSDVHRAGLDAGTGERPHRRSKATAAPAMSSQRERQAAIGGAVRRYGRHRHRRHHHWRQAARHLTRRRASAPRRQATTITGRDTSARIKAMWAASTPSPAPTISSNACSDGVDSRL